MLLAQHHKAMKISVKVVCRTNTQYKNNTAPLFVRLIQDRKTKYLSAGVAVDPAYWDFEDSVLTQDCPDRERLQQQIDAKLDAVNRQLQKFEILEIEPTLDAFSEPQKNRFNPLLKDCFQKHIDTLKKLGYNQYR